MPSERKLIVMKFGGTSVQDSPSINNVINIVENTDADKIVIVSAIAKATTALENIAGLAAQKNLPEAEKILEEIINRHHTIINTLVTDKKYKAEAAERIIKYHREI